MLSCIFLNIFGKGQIFYRLRISLYLTKFSILFFFFLPLQTLRTKILDYLNPLTAQLGIQLMTAVAAVWNSKKPHRNQSKIKVKLNKEPLGFQRKGKCCIYMISSGLVYRLIWVFFSLAFGFFFLFLLTYDKCKSKMFLFICNSTKHQGYNLT